MVLRMKIFNITGVHWKIRFLGAARKKEIYRGNCLKVGGEGGRGGLGQFADLRGDLAKKGGRVDTPMHTMVYRFHQNKLTSRYDERWSL